MKVRTRYERRAAEWDARGRPVDLLETSVAELFKMRCWLYSDGAKWDCRQEEISEVFLDFAVDSMNAELARDPYWLDRRMKERTYCDDCAERWMYDNLALCTNCQSVYCPNCVGRYKKQHENGNCCCPCGGEIVG